MGEVGELLRNQNPQNNVDKNPSTSGKCEDDKENSDDHRIDYEVIAQTATYASNNAMLIASVKSFVFHNSDVFLYDVGGEIGLHLFSQDEKNIWMTFSSFAHSYDYYSIYF